MEVARRQILEFTVVGLLPGVSGCLSVTGVANDGDQANTEQTTEDTPTGPIRAEGTAVDVTDILNQWVTGERAEIEAAQVGTEHISSALSTEFQTTSGPPVGITHVDGRRSLVIRKHAEGDGPSFHGLVSTAPRSISVTLRRPPDSDAEGYRAEFPVWVKVVSISLD